MSKNKFRIAKAIFFLLTIIPVYSYAQENDIITDRPDQTESPFVVPGKHFQMETGLIFEKADKREKSFVLPTILFRYALTNNFELRLITNFSTTESGDQIISGVNPVIVAFKLHLIKEKGIVPNTSFISNLIIPDLATEKLRTTYYAPTFKFAMQNTLSSKLSIGYNLGAAWDGESTKAVFLYTLTTDYSLTDKLTAYIELYGFTLKRAQPDHRFDCGFTYLVKSNISVDFSGGVGITKNAPDYYTSCGFSFRLKD